MVPGGRSNRSCLRYYGYFVKQNRQDRFSIFSIFSSHRQRRQDMALGNIGRVIEVALDNQATVLDKINKTEFL